MDFRTGEVGLHSHSFWSKRLRYLLQLPRQYSLQQRGLVQRERVQTMLSYGAWAWRGLLGLPPLLFRVWISEEAAAAAAAAPPIHARLPYLPAVHVFLARSDFLPAALVGAAAVTANNATPDKSLS